MLLATTIYHARYNVWKTQSLLVNTSTFFLFTALRDAISFPFLIIFLDFLLVQRASERAQSQTFSGLYVRKIVSFFLF